MSRSVVGLLAAVGTATPVLLGLTHGDSILVITAVVAGAATGLAAFVALPSGKTQTLSLTEPSTPSSTEQPIKKNRAGYHIVRDR
jgi:hypothetical protein